MTDKVHVETKENNTEPVYIQIEKSIYTLAEAEKLEEGDKLPSEGELAVKFNVSRMTVRQAMSRLEQKNVIFRVQGKGTFFRGINAGERNSSSFNNGTIGVYVSPNVPRQHPFLLEFVESMEKQASIMDVTLSFFTDISRTGVYRGIIFVSRVSVHVLEELEKRKVPFILTDEHIEIYGRAYPSVLFDSRDAAFKITEYLIKLNHRRISIFTGTLHGKLKGEGSRSKVKGYREALEKYNIPYDVSLVKECDYDNEITKRMIDEVLELKTPPTAIISCDDIGAVITINKLTEKRIKIPGDIAVVGIGDFRFNSMSSLPLTTFKFSIETAGAKAIFLLHKIMNGLPYEKTAWVKGELIERMSCGRHIEKKKLRNLTK